MFTTILVPLDGSTNGEQALVAAGRLARACGAQLRLAHVHVPLSPDPISIEGMPVIDEQLRSLAADHERVYLEQAAAAPAVADLAPALARLEGPVVPTLAAHAAAIGADLIVLTTHGRSGFMHFWLGSVAEALLRATHVPLLLLRPGAPAEPAERPLRRILVPLDGSLLAEQALAHAQAFAAIDGAKLVLARVVPQLAAPYADRAGQDAAALAAQQASATAYLGAIAARLDAQGLATEIAVSVAEQPARAILAMARELNVDLIALATHGRSGVQRALLGSTADKVLRASPVPVLAIFPA